MQGPTKSFLWLAAALSSTSAGVAQQWISVAGPRFPYAASAYDYRRERLALVDARGDYWEWTGSHFLAPPMGNPVRPPVRSRSAMAFDSTRQRFFLFGGEGANGTFNDTWVHDGTGWTQLTGGVAPAPRFDAGLCYDATRDRMVLIGGESANSAGIWNTWEHDGSGWIPGTATAPVHAPALLSFDLARSRSVLVAPMSGSGTTLTLEWDGTSWTQKASSNLTIVLGGGGRSMLYDPALGATVILDETGSAPVVRRWDGRPG